jgi:hypothetical protein
VGCILLEAAAGGLRRSSAPRYSAAGGRHRLAQPALVPSRTSTGDHGVSDSRLQASWAERTAAFPVPRGRGPGAWRNALLPALGALVVCCGGASAHPPQPSDPQASACDRYVAAVLQVGCPGPQYPPDVVARLQASFAPVCRNAFQLPGSQLTVAQLDACSAARMANNCDTVVDVPHECVFQGTLPADASCGSNAQCASGFCAFPLSASAAPDAGAPGGCGTCVAPAPVGAPCPYNICVPNAACTAPLMGPAAVPHVCMAAPNPPVVGVGADCSQATCAGDLVCTAQNVCAAGAAEGGSCTTDGDCKLGLFCKAAVCSVPAGSGGSCDSRRYESDCAPGLMCLGPGGALAVGIGVCRPQIVDLPGAPCAVGACLYGGCDPSMPGAVCPVLLGEGQACTDPTAGVCDLLSDCVNGTCQFVDSLSCWTQWPF